MQGPCAIALRQGGQGGALKYKQGVQVVVKLQGGGSAPASWKKKTTLQEAFGDYGQVLEIHAQDDGAIIEYEDHRDAQDAVASMNGKKVGGAAVVVEMRTENSRRGAPAIRGGGGVDDRVAELAHRHGLDATSSARLVNAFRDRARRGCNIDQDVNALSEHLANSNKPSALVCMKLADLREGKPIGPCKYGGRSDERDSKDKDNKGSMDTRDKPKYTKDDRAKDDKEKRPRDRSRSRKRSQDRPRDREDRPRDERSRKERSRSREDRPRR